nr:MAG TPA: RNA pseudouridylate synthase [Caudoviricetes sp.]
MILLCNYKVDISIKTCRTHIIRILLAPLRL